jgi:hypothetical protein
MQAWAEKRRRMSDDTPQARKENLIRENLRRAFDDKATEELPSDLLALLEQLRGQDDKNGTH